MADRLSPPEWIQEANDFAAARQAARAEEIAKKDAPSVTQVRVLVRAIYNGPGHKAIGWCEPGQIISVPSGSYARSLIDQGFVTRDLNVPAVPLPDEPEATPSARKLAGQRGADLRAIEGTGKGGRIIKSDVEAYLSAE